MDQIFVLASTPLKTNHIPASSRLHGRTRASACSFVFCRSLLLDLGLAISVSSVFQPRCPPRELFVLAFTRRNKSFPGLLLCPHPWRWANFPDGDARFRRPSKQMRMPLWLLPARRALRMAPLPSASMPPLVAPGSRDCARLHRKLSAEKSLFCEVQNVSARPRRNPR